MCFTVISCFPLPFVTVTLFAVRILLSYVYVLLPFTCLVFVLFVYFICFLCITYSCVSLFIRQLIYSIACLDQFRLHQFYSLVYFYPGDVLCSLRLVQYLRHAIVLSHLSFYTVSILFCHSTVLFARCLVVRYAIFVHISLAFCAVNLVGLGVLFRFLFRHCFYFYSFHMNE